MPITFKVDGGWCWMQDPRAVLTNGRMVFGSVAGATVSGASTGDDENAKAYSVATAANSTFVLYSAYRQDDHSAPVLAVLLDGRILVTYENHGGSNYVLWRATRFEAERIFLGARLEIKLIDIVRAEHG